MSVEIEVLQDYSGKLHNLIRGSIIGLSTKAMSAKLLSQEEQEKCTQMCYTDTEKANFFMQYITHRVNDNPTNMEVFLKKVLSKEPAFETTAKEMLGKLEQQKDTFMKAVQESTSHQTTQEQSTSDIGFSRSMSVSTLSDWLRSNSLDLGDCSKLRDQHVDGVCFMDLADDDLKDFKLTFGGRKCIGRLQEAVQLEEGGVGRSGRPSGVVLDINEHLRHLVNETWDARSQWHHIGRDLGIDQGTLESIATAKMRIPDECYPEVLAHWLRQANATWGCLLKVLESPPVGHVSVAQKIRGLPLARQKEIGYC